MNTVILIGRLARDPELSYTQNQTAACRFTLAVDRPKRNGEDQGADFIRVVAWNKQAEVVDKYLSKGRQVAVQGRIQTGSYKNKDGQTVYTTEVVTEKIKFIGSSGQQTKNEPQYTDCQSGAAPVASPQPTQIDMSNIPDAFIAIEDDIPY